MVTPNNNTLKSEQQTKTTRNNEIILIIPTIINQSQMFQPQNAPEYYSPPRIAAARIDTSCTVVLVERCITFFSWGFLSPQINEELYVPVTSKN